MESSAQDYWPEKKIPVEATSLSSGSDSSVEYSKGMSNRKRKQSYNADEVKANVTKFSRNKKGVKKRVVCRGGSDDDEWQCDEKEKKLRSSVKKRAKKEVVDDDKEWEEEFRVFSFMKATSRRSNKTSETDSICFLGNETDVSSCSRYESELSDSRRNNGNFNDCRSMTKSLKSDLGKLAICHQCLKGGRRMLFICTVCEERFYCLPCIKKWYPNLSEDDVIEKCPFCRGICNCCSCLHSSGLIETSKRKLSNYERFRHLHYLIGSMLPFLKMLCKAQDQEIETEANVMGPLQLLRQDFLFLHS